METMDDVLLKEIEALHAKNAQHEVHIANLNQNVDDQQVLFLNALTKSNRLAQQRLAEIEKPDQGAVFTFTIPKNLESNK